MDLKIYSLDAIKKALLARELLDYDVLSIRDSNAPRMAYHEIDVGTGLRKELFVSEMDDIKTPHDLLVMPSVSGIVRVLAWAKGRERIAVHCTAGIARSSALAYLIACREEGPVKAILRLDESRHWPNALITSLGARVLMDPKVHSTVSKWKRDSKDILRRPLELRRGHDGGKA